MDTKLCIFFLSDRDRHYTFELFTKNLGHSLYKNQIIVLLLLHNDDEDFYKPFLERNLIQYKIISVPIENNYLLKIKSGVTFAEQMNIPYVMKHDNDIIIGSSMYDFLFENMNCLEKSENLLLTPTLTSGIPTVEQFSNDFLNEQEQLSLSNKYLEYKFQTNTWGVDYSSLNKFTVESKKWDPTSYFNAVKQINHPYKGIHPIRMYRPAIEELNTCVLKYSNKILSQKPTDLVYDSTSPYFCNSVFIIKREIYSTILGTNSIFIDPFEEVPINLWRIFHNKSIVYTKEGAAIHIIYNSIPDHNEYEKDFMKQLLISDNFITILSNYENIQTELGTDKNTSHSYGETYNMLFKEYKEIKKFLEIGIDGGSALQCYSEYFPYAHIYGLDIKDNVLSYIKKNPRIHLTFGDATDTSVIQTMSGDYNIIIEDASHRLSDQIRHFFDFSKFVKQGGLYIIEDVHQNNLKNLDEVLRPIALENGFTLIIYNLCHIKNRFDDILFVFKKL